MKHRLHYLFLAGILFTLSGCLVVDESFEGMAPGPWRAILKLDPGTITANPRGEPLPEKMDMQFEEVAAGQLPFTFDVIYPDPQNKNDFYLEVINGEERIPVKDIYYGRDRATANDTVLINFPVFDSYLKGIYKEGILQGEWVVNNRENYRIPFVGYHGKDFRFTNLKKAPVMDLSGKWEVTFGIDTEEPYPAIGLFEQDGNHITGTFLTETGDYRYLEGTVQGDKLYLSVFDGAHAFLFEAKVREDSTMIGSFRSGTHYRTLWEAKRNPDVTLADPHEMTYLKEGYDRVDFSFKNTEGKIISLDDERYQDKVTIVQLMGTWCPNCRDETNFLVDYLAAHPNQEIEVIALAFERYREEEKAMNALQKYKEQFGMDYELLLAGYHDKAEAAQALPMLNKVISYPTMIIMDKDKQVQRIHTGFSGPATPEYATFKTDFEAYITSLLEK